jgi:hypothetical protein
MGTATVGETRRRASAHAGVIGAAVAALLVAGGGAALLHASRGVGQAAARRTVRAHGLPANGHRPGDLRSTAGESTAVDRSLAGGHPLANVVPDPPYGTWPSTAGASPQPAPAPACWSDAGAGWVPDPAAPACLETEVQATDAARAREGLGPLHLPAHFGSLSPEEQLFVLADIERVSRGEQPVLGLASALSQDAQRAAVAGNDPQFLFSTVPSSSWWGSNWATGVLNAADANYTWMYADGPGGFNVECPHRSAAGCWGHRANILASPRGGTLIMGAGAVTLPTGLSSDSELFVAVRSLRDIPPLTYTWAQAVAAGAGG